MCYGDFTIYGLSGDPLFSHFKSLLGLLSEAVYIQGMSTLAILLTPMVQVLRSGFLRLAEGFDQYELSMALSKLATESCQSHVIGCAFSKVVHTFKIFRKNVRHRLDRTWAVVDTVGIGSVSLLLTVPPNLHSRDQSNSLP